MEKNEVTTGSGWFSLALTLVFITLKLTDQIDWSWWWVLAPLWIPWVIIIAVLVVFGIFVLLIK